MSSLFIINNTYKEFVVITQMFKSVLYIIESFINSETMRFLTHNYSRFTLETSMNGWAPYTAAQIKLTHMLRK